MAKKVNVTPLHDRVIVKAAAAEEKTADSSNELDEKMEDILAAQDLL